MIRKRNKAKEEIYNVLKNTKSHPGAEEIYSEVKKKIPSIGLATVYRNLAKLKKEKMIIGIDADEQREHFDADISLHYHMVCEKCGSITDLETEPLQNLNALAEKACGGVVKSHTLTFYGVCKKCAEK